MLSKVESVWKVRIGRQKLCLLVLFSLILTGCGGNAIQGNRNAGTERAASEGAVSGSAVSGSAVSESAVSGGTIQGEDAENQKAPEERGSEKADDKKYRYSTDTNLYYTDWDETSHEPVIVQVRLDGTHKKKIAGAYDYYDGADVFLVYVDENGLYYNIIDDNNMGGEELYYVPIEKDAQGYDVVKRSGEEVLSKEDDICTVYADSQYMLYDTCEEIVKIDMRKKKIHSRQKIADLAEDSDFGWEFFRLSDCFVAIAEEGGIYVQKTEGSEWRRISDKRWMDEEDRIVQTGDCLFCGSYRDYDAYTWTVLKCDGEGTEPFITLEQVGKAVGKVRGAKAAAGVNSESVTELFGDAGRLYVQVGLIWEEAGVTRAEYLLFSRGERESELRYEKKLTESMQSKVKNRHGRWGIQSSENDKLETVYTENAVMNDARCVCMMDGKAYLSLYDYENDKGRLGCYELQSGAFQWISKKEAKFGVLGRAGEFDEGAMLRAAFGKENFFTGVWTLPDDWEEVADFYEKK